MMYRSVEVKLQIFLRLWLKMEASSQHHTTAFFTWNSLLAPTAREGHQKKYKEKNSCL
jgi:hypothetical protein